MQKQGDQLLKSWKFWTGIILVILIELGAIFAGIMALQNKTEGPEYFMDDPLAYGSPTENVFNEILFYTNEHHALPAGMEEYSATYEHKDPYCQPSTDTFSSRNDCFSEVSDLHIAVDENLTASRDFPLKEGTLELTGPGSPVFIFYFGGRGDWEESLEISYTYNIDTNHLYRSVHLDNSPFGASRGLVDSFFEGTEWTFDDVVAQTDEQMSAFVSSWCEAYPQTNFSSENWGNVEIIDGTLEGS